MTVGESTPKQTPEMILKHHFQSINGEIVDYSYSLESLISISSWETEQSNCRQSSTIPLLIDKITNMKLFIIKSVGN